MVTSPEKVLPKRKRPLAHPNVVIREDGRKYLADFIIAAFVGLFILSWLIPIISLLIALTSRGPIFFVQVRTGRNGRTFNCLKFRTMYVDQSKVFRQAEKNDPRITPIGQWLRKNNLDEVPQFLNVLMGDMSIIGPRPHPTTLDAMYWFELPHYEERYHIRPGITGLAQSRNARGITDHPLKMKHRLKYDLFYRQHCSFQLDLAICWWTVVSMIKGDPNAW